MCNPQQAYIMLDTHNGLCMQLGKVAVNAGNQPEHSY